MKYSLDTNACIRLLNGRSAKRFEHFDSVQNTDIAVCSVVRAELFYGSAKSQTPDRSRAKQDRFLSSFATLPFDDAAASLYGRIRAVLDAAGTPIGGNDLLIAAITMAHELTLITHNTREFGHVDGLKIEDWEL